MRNVLKILAEYGLRLLAMLRRNWGYKLLALIFAMILWASVMSSVNPVKNKDFSDVPIHLENLATLREKGMTLLGSVDSYGGLTADVRLDIPWNSLQNVTRSAITLYVDLSRITETGEQEVPVLAQTSSGRVVSYSPDTVKVVVEDYISRPVPVVVDLQGGLPEGYWRDKEGMEVSLSTLRVQGPRSLVEQVRKASVPLLLDGLTADFSASLPFVLLGAGGEAVDSGPMEFSDEYIIVSLPVRPTRSVPVLIEEALVGADDLPDGYEITRVEVYPEKVTVAAPADVLETIRGISLTSIDVSDATEDISGTAALTVPEGAVLLDEGVADYRIRVEEIETTMTFEDVPIIIRGLDDKLTAEATEQTARVTVTGPIRSMSSLLASSVKLYVDADDLQAGVYTLEVLADIHERYRVRTVVIQPEAVDVTLSVK